MENINNFQVDRNLDPKSQNKKIVNFIDDFLGQEKINILLTRLSNMYNIPKKVFYQDLRLVIFSNYRNSIGKFLPTFSFFKIFSTFFTYIMRAVLMD